MDVKDVSFKDNEEKHSHRLSEYKSRSVICDQESRRFQLLQNQKRRREETFNTFRNTTELLSESENEGEEGEKEESMEWTDSKPKRPRLKDMFMFSEWMMKLPEDLEDKWLFVLCPIGKRCLVRCAKGYTSVYGRRGHKLAKFQSLLPNGSQRDYSGSRYSNSEVTLLDCIWCPQTKTYFILDLLSWKGQLYMDTETSFRVFWIKSKMEEMPWMLERSEKNPFPFIPLNFHSCDTPTIASVISQCPHFPSDEPKIDGVLFYHSQAYYTSGYTPLVVWLKPFMIPEILGIPIPEVYSKTKPSAYVDMNHFISSYEEKQKQRKRKPRRSRKGNQMEGEEGEGEEGAVVEMLEE